MGYTHYFSLPSDTKVSQFRKLATKVNKLVKAAHDRGIKVTYDMDFPYTRPLVSPDGIRLNGVGEEAHETFYLPRVDGCDDFCKTARKPYDLVVAATLLVASQELDGFSYGSDGIWHDGIDDEWKDAQAFVEEVLGERIEINVR